MNYILLLLLGLFINSHEIKNDPVLPCKMASYTPIIDGKLIEACWYESAKGIDFKLVNGAGSAQEQTEIMTAYDVDNLYIGIICYEEDINHIRRKQYIKDSQLWRDDCVEIFLDINHDHKSYFHLITNSAGIRYDEIGRLNPSNWDPDWKVKTGKFEGGWSVEIQLPLKDVNLLNPQPGKIIGFNVNRQQHKLGELSSWSETDYDFHEPNNFGHLMFAPIL